MIKFLDPLDHFVRVGSDPYIIRFLSMKCIFGLDRAGSEAFNTLPIPKKSSNLKNQNILHKKSKETKAQIR